MTDLDRLYPKWICPICKDWFHMPWKFCQCDRPDQSGGGYVAKRKCPNETPPKP